MFVDHGQEPGLQGCGQAFDILQDQRAAACLFDQRLVLIFAHRAEQACGQRVFVMGRAGQRDKAFASARADRVQRMGHQRLASARFPQDQDVTIRLTQIKDILAQAVHHRAGADQLAHQDRAIGQFAPERTIVERQPPLLAGPLGQFGHPFGVEGLFQKIIGADSHRFDRHGHIAMSGDHDHRQATIHPHQPLEQRHAIHAGHAHIADNHPRPIRAHDLQRLFGGGKGFGLESRQRQPLADRLAHVLFVIYNRDLHLRRPFVSLSRPDAAARQQWQADFEHCAAGLAIARGQPPAKIGDDTR